MIRRFEYDMPEKHAAEMSACAEMVKREKPWQKETLDSYAALEDSYAGYFSCAPGREFARATAAINAGPPLRILDVGAGRGETSLYLSSFGHHVSPVEPSYDFCWVIDYLAGRFGKDLTIYNCSAEALDMADAQFDVVVFNVSLHHCDDPVGALRNLHRLLVPGGKLMVMGEPMLPFFKTQEQWLAKIASSAEETGDYGGNEHIYHHGEYVAMIRKAGFRNVRSEPAARYRSKEVLEESIANDLHHSKLRKLVKSSYLHGVYLLNRARLRPAIALMQRLSLIQTTFTATA